MAHWQEQTIQDIPTLACYRQDGRPKPLVLCAHGFSGAKEDLQEQLEILATAGYYALALDNRAHGDRPPPRFREAAFSGRGLDLYQVRRLIKETADDVVTLLDHLCPGSEIDPGQADPEINPGRIAMLGSSMGGYVTFRALVIDERIRVAAPLISSPYWDDVPADVRIDDSPQARQRLAQYAAQYAPAVTPGRFYPRPLLVQVGGRDNHLNPRRVSGFCRKLKPYYAADPRRLRLVFEPKVGHRITQAMWDNVWDWLHTFL